MSGHQKTLIGWVVGEAARHVETLTEEQVCHAAVVVVVVLVVVVVMVLVVVTLVVVGWVVGMGMAVVGVVIVRFYPYVSMSMSYR